mgnify:CR=1 FL=1
MTTETLRAAIEAALRRRDARGMAALLACDDADVDGSIRATTAHTSDDAIRALAIAAGLRDDGSDPAEEVERLRVAFRREEDRADARAQDLDDLVARVWRAATGDTHEGPASVDALAEAVAGLRADNARLDNATRGALDDLAKVRAELNAARLALARRDAEYLELARRSERRGFELRAAQVEAHTARRSLAMLAAVARRERDARAEWLDSLPGGSCGNPPPAALIDAETATGEVLRAIEAAEVSR